MMALIFKKNCLTVYAFYCIYLPSPALPNALEPMLGPLFREIAGLACVPRRMISACPRNGSASQPTTSLPPAIMMCVQLRLKKEREGKCTNI